MKQKSYDEHGAHFIRIDLKKAKRAYSNGLAVIAVKDGEKTVIQKGSETDISLPMKGAEYFIPVKKVSRFTGTAPQTGEQTVFEYDKTAISAGETKRV